MGVKTRNASGTAGEIWFSVQAPLVSPAMRLFCFTHAGGSCAEFHGWHRWLPKNVEVCGIQMPGRGKRFREAPYTDLGLLVTDLCDAISPYLDLPFAFFGHSVGALVAFELASKLRLGDKPEPNQLFLSAFPAPHLKMSHNKLHHLPEDEFRNAIQALNGMPDAVNNDPELMSIAYPLIRADCKLVESREYSSPKPLNTPMVILGGIADQQVSIDALEQWAKFTSGGFQLVLFPGDHFYIHTQKEALLDSLSGFTEQILMGQGSKHTRAISDEVNNFI